MINLTPLNTGLINEIIISGVYDLEKFTNEEIKKITPVQVEGEIIRKENNDLELEDYINCTIKTTITIEDSISLEDVEYEINTEFHDFLEQNWKNDENMLDIFQFLWENIVLEVPLRFTKVQDLSKFHGDGWKLISEEERNQTSNPFSELIKEMESEG
ncbi:MAG: hypothetical protein IKE70_04080 [Bacilli bacterium]|nr:hypothetical protein [Bacilli bacterium]